MAAPRSARSLGSAPIVSPDSRYVAFVGLGGKETTGKLYVRDRGSPGDMIQVPGTENASYPFWSPDSASIGFFARGRLMTVAWQGGAPVAVAEQTLFPFGGSWGRSGAVIFAPDVIMSGLHRVAAAGQTAEPTTIVDLSLGDTSHCWPVFLPDGVHFLYFLRSTRDERRGVYIGRVDRPAPRRDPLLLRTDSNVVYVPVPGVAEGALLYVVDGRVEARRFDPTTMRLIGDVRTIAGVLAAGATLAQPAMLSASADLLVFAESTVPYGNRLEVVDRWNEPPRTRFWPERSSNATHACLPTGDGSRTCPTRQVDRKCRFAASSGPRNGSSSRARAGISRCGEVTAPSCSSSILKDSCRAYRSTGAATSAPASDCRRS
jgi:hypothetical protein